MLCRAHQRRAHIVLYSIACCVQCHSCAAGPRDRFVSELGRARLATTPSSCELAGTSVPPQQRCESHVSLTAATRYAALPRLRRRRLPKSRARLRGGARRASSIAHVRRSQRPRNARERGEGLRQGSRPGRCRRARSDAVAHHRVESAVTTSQGAQSALRSNPTTAHHIRHASEN